MQKVIYEKLFAISPKNIDFKDYERDEFNPVQIDNTDVNFEFDNENAIVVDFNKKKK